MNVVGHVVESRLDLFADPRPPPVMVSEFVGRMKRLDAPIEPIENLRESFVDLLSLPRLKLRDLVNDGLNRRRQLKLLYSVLVPRHLESIHRPCDCRRAR